MVTASKTQTDVDVLVDDLEAMCREGFFDEPRHLSEVATHLKTSGKTVDLASLGLALLEMSEHKELFRTVLGDGLLRYVDGSKGRDWPSLDLAPLMLSPRSAAASKRLDARNK